MEPAIQQELFELLSHTSRSFAIGIMGLEVPLKDEVCLGYLLCRILDTYEDSLDISAPLRADILAYSLNLLDQLNDPKAFGDLLGQWTLKHKFDSEWPASRHPDEWEHRLLARGDAVWRELAKLSPASRKAFQKSLRDMVTGMRVEVVDRQIQGRHEARTMQETDTYCYTVAGTVGCLLTELFNEQGAFEAGVTEELSREGIEFGKALQLVNILKDFHKDWVEGRCYWPGIPLPPGKNSPLPADVELEKIFGELKSQFELYLKSAESYIRRLKASKKDMYFFCAFPLKMAVATLHQASSDMTWLNTGGTFKVSRLKVAHILSELAL